MTKLTKLAFDLVGDFSDSKTRLPMQIRDKHMTIKATGLSDTHVEVPAGTYFVTARMPDGTLPVLAGPLKVSADDEVTRVVVEPRNSFFPTPPGHGGGTATMSGQTGGILDEWRKALRSSASSLAETTTQIMVNDGELEKPQVEANLLGNPHVWRGRWFDSWLRSYSLATEIAEPLTSNGISLRANMRRRGEQTLVSVREPDTGFATFFAIPFDGPGPLTTRIGLSWDSRTTIKDGEHSEAKRPKVSIFFQDSELTAFLRYIHHSNALEAADFARSYVGRCIGAGSSELKSLKSWLGPVLGCYVLLRRNELNGLDECTSNLLRLARHVPDVLALRVEYLARIGEHAEAANQLVELESFGCPWFRSGIEYLRDRVRSYEQGMEGLEVSSQLKLASFGEALVRLTSYLDPEFTTAIYRHVPLAKFSNL
ncbi:hypothetical protein [Methylomonas rivi]|uniref:Uncharacterized protein n=1 Tax=Methylomonas rivi TaxID=2952226 RepID=A0ABT1U989_9GAMM|nr:hypothetical protein [Methylomonas sp. WSC-6]MCQ8130362.1 hypothetical protein [Methylomonas sp. WSC-6]